MTGHSLGGVVLLLALFVATQYPAALRVPFINDDYVFLEKTRNASFAALWRLSDLTFHWYRPWSRELHYWTLQRLFDSSEPAFHAVSLILWLGVLLGYFAFVRRIAGGAVAGIAVAGVTAMGAWAVPALWVAGVQDLWMLLFSLLSLLALARGRVAWSAAALGLALLSKETAVVVPVIAFLFGVTIERQGFASALRRVTPHAVLVLAWAAIHPLIGGRLWRGVQPVPTPGLHASPASSVLRTVLAPLNLEALPAPDVGARFLPRAIAAAAILVALVWWSRRSASARRPDADAGKLAAFGAGWAVAGWLPVMLPSLGWHSYYTLLGAMGAWLAIATGLARAPRVAVAAVAALAILRGAAASTPSLDWGTEWYQRRAASFLDFMRADLLRKQPRVPSHSRLFFTEVPSNVGFITEGAPALRVWYRDTTLAGGFLGDYQRRPAGQSGEDFFFRYDSTSGWVEIENGQDGLPPSPAANPRWERDHRDLAAAMARAEDWPAAARQFERLAARDPGNPEYALNAGICYETMRDSARADRWYERVVASGRAKQEDQEFARRFRLRFRVAR